MIPSSLETSGLSYSLWSKFLLLGKKKLKNIHLAGGGGVSGVGGGCETGLEKWKKPSPAGSTQQSGSTAPRASGQDPEAPGADRRRSCRTGGGPSTAMVSTPSKHSRCSGRTSPRGCRGRGQRARSNQFHFWVFKSQERKLLNVLRISPLRWADFSLTCVWWGSRRTILLKWALLQLNATGTEKWYTSDNRV